MKRFVRGKDGKFSGSIGSGVTPPSTMERRSLLDRLLNRHSATASTAAPSGDDPFGNLSATYDSYQQAAQPSRLVEEFSSDPGWFGMGNSGHVALAAMRREFTDVLHRPIDYTNPDGTRVHIDFDTDAAGNVARRMAYQVLVESGEVSDRGYSSYRAHADVYSPETRESAMRIYRDMSSTTFATQKFPGEGTAAFESTRTESGGLTSYTHTVHPEIRRMLSGVDADQARHVGLQKDIREEADRRAQSASRAALKQDPFADI